MMRRVVISIAVAFAVLAGAQTSTSNVTRVKAWIRAHVMSIQGGGLRDPSGEIADQQRAQVAAETVAISSNLVAAAGQGLTNALDRLWDAADNTNRFVDRVYIAADMEPDLNVTNIEAYIIRETQSPTSTVFCVHYTKTLAIPPTTSWKFDLGGKGVYWSTVTLPTNATPEMVDGFACYSIEVPMPAAASNMVLRSERFLRWGSVNDPLDISSAGLMLDEEVPFAGVVVITNDTHVVTETYSSGLLMAKTEVKL